ncbi:MAG: ribosome small subunit-dependent GTPase A [Defluviitaleaceae bacterium]|nr:ribosome small subunit-dependent GTPase A [Defluviitaleaceae bacterium]MCL2836148.1 ribosome small subunit-dependent GTPase A [Defluviitaleaceae bacterium]
MHEESLTGRIVKGVAGIYDVCVPGHGRFACPARGLFKKLGQTPIPGDLAVITRIDMGKRTAYLHKLLERSNELIRPRAANVTQALLVFSTVSPEVNLLVVDTMLAYMHSAGIEPVLCVNKTDITPASSIGELQKLYTPGGYRVFPVSAAKREGLDSLAGILPGQVTILAGPSGVGKSSIVNAMFPGLSLETGELSAKIQRGKNTTRSCELFEIGPDTYLADSPGFTSFDAALLPNLPKEGLDQFFPEFADFLGRCYYGDCLHVSEHDCAVKEQIGEAIPPARYENYVKLVARK